MQKDFFARWRVLPGLLILVGAFLAGEFLRARFGLIVPGNILGLFGLLALLAAGIVRLSWVEAAAGLLLILLPLLFLPVFVGAAEDRRFWAESGLVYATTIILGTFALWAFVGHLAQWLLARSPAAVGDPGPLTDAEVRAAETTAQTGETLHATAGPAAVEPTGRPALAVIMTDLAVYLVLAVGCGGAGCSAAVFPKPVALLVWSGLTVLVYVGARRLFQTLKQPLLHPMFTALFAMIGLVELAGRRYGEYRGATGWIGWWLGPAVVAMAVPVWRLRTLLLTRLPLIAGVITAGLGFGFGLMAWVLRALGQPPPVAAAGTLKNITSPVAIEIARGMHGAVRLDAVIASVVLAGAAGATLGPGLLRWIGVRDRRARGLAMGCGSHGVGVARAMEVDSVCGAFATLGMSGTAMLGATVCPYLLRWVFG